MSGIYVVVIKNGLVTDIFAYSESEREDAERQFVNAMESNFSNFDEYTQEDIDACLEDGYAGFGSGNSIQLHWEI